MMRKRVDLIKINRAQQRMAYANMPTAHTEQVHINPINFKNWVLVVISFLWQDQFCNGSVNTIAEALTKLGQLYSM
jgi:hypothetical protein